MVAHNFSSGWLEDGLYARAPAKRPWRCKVSSGSGPEIVHFRSFWSRSIVCLSRLIPHTLLLLVIPSPSLTLASRRPPWMPMPTASQIAHRHEDIGRASPRIVPPLSIAPPVQRIAISTRPFGARRFATVVRLARALAPKSHRFGLGPASRGIAVSYHLDFPTHHQSLVLPSRSIHTYTHTLSRSFLPRHRPSPHVSMVSIASPSLAYVPFKTSSSLSAAFGHPQDTVRALCFVLVYSAFASFHLET
ncbi:hypothetical protein EDB89DRAFT_1201568 [Lactarius sanguifluus]|nr:hypothetical protein EDB89DRAFT_1201568 [Lactarius sanguifluus]